MVTEDELKAALHRASAPNTLDASRIIARSRARRLPRQVAAGAFGAFAVAGIFVVSLQVIPPGQDQTTALTSSESAQDETAGAATESSIKRAPAEGINVCGLPIADVAPSVYGLEFSLDFPATNPVGTSAIEGTVRLTNTSSQRVFGTTTAAPALTLARDGIVTWHSTGRTIMAPTIVELAPGESHEYIASFEPVECASTDDEAVGATRDLPALAAGQYELSALIDFTPDESLVADGITYVDLVSGLSTTITLQ